MLRGVSNTLGKDRQTIDAKGRSIKHPESESLSPSMPKTCSVRGKTGQLGEAEASGQSRLVTSSARDRQGRTYNVKLYEVHVPTK
jgi:hypothetical protein